MAMTAKRCCVAGQGGTMLLCRLVLLGAFSLALAACDTEDLDVRRAMMKEVAGAIPGTDQPYPNLASVPAAPTATAKAARDQLQKKLEADNKATTYAPDKSAAPEIPAPPPALPKGFVEAEQPVKLADAAAPPAAGQPAAKPAEKAPAAALRDGAAGSGILGAGRRAAIVFFAPGSSEIDPGQLGKLRPLVEKVRREGGSLQLVGHAAEEAVEGSEGKLEDFDLSVMRANALARALVRLGLAKDELAINGEGDRTPVASLAGMTGAAANRRVDVFSEN